MIIYIGIDDFDSRRVGCTTHLAYIIIKKLTSLGYNVIGYPYLVRLNPDVPWKTRGNGAVSIKINVNKVDIDNLISVVKQITLEYYESDENTNPGIIILKGKYIPKDFIDIYLSSLKRLVALSEVYLVLNKFRDRVVFWSFGDGKGLIGAAAAIGARAKISDYTYELLVYRPLTRRNKIRNITIVQPIDEDITKTFANIDYETKRILITPHGPDPVIFGIRGESPSLLKEAAKKIQVKEFMIGQQVFLTNQGTFSNYQYIDTKHIAEADLYTQFIVSGVIKEKYVIRGGHIHLVIEDSSSYIEAMIYEPSGRMREFLINMGRGIPITIYGGVKPKNGRYTINTQMIFFNKEVWCISQTAPICPKCLKSMVSEGVNKGFKCKKCNYHIKFDINLTIGKNMYVPNILLPPLRSIRHIAKPLKRFGREKTTFIHN